MIYLQALLPVSWRFSRIYRMSSCAERSCSTFHFAMRLALLKNVYQSNANFLIATQIDTANRTLIRILVGSDPWT